jgi:hypothetical protein
MICSSEQLEKLLKMKVMFGPARLAVENVSQENIAHGRVMLVRDVSEIDPDFIISWVYSFVPIDPDVGVMVEVIEINSSHEYYKRLVEDKELKKWLTL